MVLPEGSDMKAPRGFENPFGAFLFACLSEIALSLQKEQIHFQKGGPYEDKRNLAKYHRRLRSPHGPAPWQRPVAG
jgi:hypothetical protein